MPEAVETDGSWTGMGHLHSEHHGLCVCYILLLWSHAQGKACCFHGPASTFTRDQLVDMLSPQAVFVVLLSYRCLSVCFFKNPRKLSSYVVVLYKIPPHTFTSYYLHSGSASFSFSLAACVSCTDFHLQQFIFFTYIYKVAKKHNLHFGLLGAYDMYI